LNKGAVVDLLKKVVGDENLFIDAPMKKHISFKVGGPADILVTPDNSEKLIQVIDICRRYSIPFITIGNGTNLIVRDKGIRGVVIKLFDRFNGYSVLEETIIADAGVLLSTLANIALKNNLSGLEFGAGIPGTLGGAVAMNAGAYGGEIKDVVFRTHYIDKENEVKVLEGEEHQFGYRTSYIQKESGIVIKAELKLKNGIREEIESRMDDFNKRRKEKQPLEMPSAGSVFKRPVGHYTGKLIEDCGLKGFRIGGAEVSEKHCGFIVNSGNATAVDVVSLIRHIQSEVLNKYGVELQTEVRIIGEE